MGEVEINCIIVGARGLIGTKISEELERRGLNIVRVSSQSQMDVYGSLFDALKTCRNSNKKNHVVYLNYVKNPVKNLRLLLAACWAARGSAVESFFYFSTFAHDPSFCGVREANYWPRFRSMLNVYNLNKFLAELAYVCAVRFLFQPRTRCFVVSPGFVLGRGMIWNKILEDFCKDSELRCPPLHSTLPVVDIQELAGAIWNGVHNSLVELPIVFGKRKSIYNILRDVVNDSGGTLPILHEGSLENKSLSKIRKLPPEVFYFSK